MTNPRDAQTAPEQDPLNTSGWAPMECDPKSVANWWLPPNHPLATICEAATEEAAQLIADALNERAVRADTPARAGMGAEAAHWRKTTDGLPQKPGLKSYEQIECLIMLPNGDLEISMWNCEHEVWDDAEGDDYRHDPCKPTHWMPLAPIRAALRALAGEA